MFRYIGCQECQAGCQRVGTNACQCVRLQCLRAGRNQSSLTERLGRPAAATPRTEARARAENFMVTFFKSQGRQCQVLQFVSVFDSTFLHLLYELKIYKIISKLT
jgi:hypothetical protein